MTLQKKRKNQQRRKKIKEFQSDSNSSGSYKSVDESEDEENPETFFDNILTNYQQEEYDLLCDNVITLEETKLFEGQDIKNLTIKDTRSNREPVFETVAILKAHQTRSEQIHYPSVGNFIVAKFSSSKGKRTYKYVCLIDEVVTKRS